MDRIANERFRGIPKVGELSKKVLERKLKWYGRVMGRDEEYVVKRVMSMHMEERKPKTEMDGQCKAKGLSGKKTQNRVVWRQLIGNIDPT